MKTIKEILKSGLVGVGIVAVIMAIALPHMPLKASINTTDCIERVAYRNVIGERYPVEYLQDDSEQVQMYTLTGVYTTDTENTENTETTATEDTEPHYTITTSVYCKECHKLIEVQNGQTASDTLYEHDIEQHGYIEHEYCTEECSRQRGKQNEI